MKKLIIILAIALSGCAHQNSILKETQKQEFRIPEEFKTECKDLPKANSSLDDDLLQQFKEVASTYRECKEWNSAKTKYLKSLEH